ncbi:hypothetical protein SESBI_05414 [Sesbania bispinosa]|nr:hypothetical protein SESBI_05414 [Sesbania bispinosa]
MEDASAATMVFMEAMAMEDGHGGVGEVSTLQGEEESKREKKSLSCEEMKRKRRLKLERIEET